MTSVAPTQSTVNPGTVLQLIRDHYRTHGRGITLTQISPSVNARFNDLGTLVLQLIDDGVVQRDMLGRLTVAGEAGPRDKVPTTQLAPDELERVRRGEPSTGSQTKCIGIPSAAYITVRTPPPTRVMPAGGGSR